ncbi:UDP-N-acetyl-D-glucosamine dehydrogenase [Salibacterium salarium]|uniref:nucleotide sugar dehydrogenase n=1 Tax=Salibacterium salarium TaxID=284579 RepID=UPI002786A0C3|nr:nucleotide sugar dehydrogenase [Salibacterium salarium]MDQ0300703.1 UDP-N-acetyl-D-glucosamine dehydrogenase [Salibacterium salarium]
MNSYENTIHVPAHTRVGVVGLGYVGLPLALLFLQKGYQVTGLDIDKKKINDLQKSVSHIPDIEDDELKHALSSGGLTFTANYDLTASLDIIVVCVPTPLSSEGQPDLKYLKSVSEQLGPRLRRNQMVIIESSTYPGTTREVVQPLLELSKLRVGEEFSLGYSPERIDPGNKTMKVEHIPKVVSGVTENCLRSVTTFYENIFEDVVPVPSVEIAELSKLLENSYRFINISFINEVAMLCDKLNINVWEAITAANTKPYGFHPFYPGPGIGGHCIPVDPLYLYWAGNEHGFHNKFLSLAEQTNNYITLYVLEQIKERIEKEKGIANAKILLCGISYKKDSNDLRSSPGIKMLKYFTKLGADVEYHDPFVPEVVIDGQKYKSSPISEKKLGQTDCVVILQDHSPVSIQKMMDYATLIYDTRNATKGWNGKAETIVLGGGMDSL